MLPRPPLLLLIMLLSLSSPFALLPSLGPSSTRQLPRPLSRLLSTSPPEPTTEEVDPGITPGTDLRVVKYPHPSLRAANAPVTDAEIEDGSIKQIAKEMFLVMYKSEGVGLAAPQVNVNKVSPRAELGGGRGGGFR